MRPCVLPFLMVLANVACSEPAPDAGSQSADSGMFFISGDGLNSNADAAASDAPTTDLSSPDMMAACPGGGGCPCKENLDCAGALCLETADGRRCAIACR